MHSWRIYKFKSTCDYFQSMLVCRTCNLTNKKDQKFPIPTS
uniref:Uncharacterized protein n=1 Tax=Arundo donax TaxID=35708 RepID=A0A0A9ANP9_ARUDO